MSTISRYVNAVLNHCFAGDKESSFMTHEDSRINVEIMDEIRSQIGIRYDVD